MFCSIVHSLTHAQLLFSSVLLQWSGDTGQRIPFFDRCQLVITWMSNSKEVHGKPKLHVLVNLLFGDNLVLSTGLIMWIGHRKEIRKLTFRTLALRRNDSLRRRANARNVSFWISLRWPIHIINPVDKTKLSCYTSHRRSTTVSLETYPSILLFGVWPPSWATPPPLSSSSSSSSSSCIRTH